MKKTFVILSLAAALVVASDAKTNVNASDRTSQTSVSSIKKSTKQVTQIPSDQLEEFAQKNGLTPPVPGATLASVTISIDPSAIPSSPSATIHPEWCSGLYLNNVYTGGDSVGTQVIRRSYYQGPTTSTMTVTESVSAQWSSNVSIGVDKVSVGVGFNVTETTTVSDTYQVVVPAGKSATVEARPVFMNKYFEIWNDVCVGSDYKVGSGWASKPIGVSFVQWIQ